MWACLWLCDNLHNTSRPTVDFFLTLAESARHCSGILRNQQIRRYRNGWCNLFILRAVSALLPQLNPERLMECPTMNNLRDGAKAIYSFLNPIWLGKGQRKEVLCCCPSTTLQKTESLSPAVRCLASMFSTHSMTVKQILAASSVAPLVGCSCTAIAWTRPPWHAC